MKILCTLLIFASTYCFGQEFKIIDDFILQENRRGLVFSVTGGSSQSVWINCPVEVYDELYQDRNGYAAIMHLYQKVIEQNPKTNNQTIENLLMLAILGEPPKGERSLNDEKKIYIWGVSRIRTEAIFAGFPECIEDWEIWGSKLDARNRFLREHEKQN